MKNIKIVISIICVIFVFVSCQKDFIDLEPKNKLTTDVALSTLDGLEGSILGVYERGRFIYTSNDYSLYKCCNTDLIQPGSHLTDQSVFNEYVRLTGFDAENTAVEDVWNGYYTGLSRCNIIIEGIDNVAIDPSNDEQVKRKNVVLGEAYYFRAYFHYELIERYGHIVLSDHVYKDPSEGVVLADSSDVYDLIVSDLQTAIPLLPEATDVISRGKVSKGVARHLLSKVYMILGRWSDAAEMAVSVIDDPAYNNLNLNEVPIADIFSCEYQENKEIIFSWQFTQNDIDNPQRTSTQFFPLYDRISGVRRSFYQGARPWSRLQPTPYYWTLFDDNDLRLDAWHIRYWVYDFEGEDPVNGLENELPPGVNLGDTVTAENVGGTSGFDINILIVPTTLKYAEDSTLGMNLADAEGFRNIIQFRVSEAYLIAAEAYLRADQPDVGQPYLDAVRARAGVDPIDLTLDNIIDEQARELGHEGLRYGFLKRQGLLYERVQEHSPEIGSVMLPYHVRWPIPKSFVDLTKVQQNEGYE